MAWRRVSAPYLSVTNGMKTNLSSIPECYQLQNASHYHTCVLPMAWRRVSVTYLWVTNHKMCHINIPECYQWHGDVSLQHTWVLPMTWRCVQKGFSAGKNLRRRHLLEVVLAQIHELVITCRLCCRKRTSSSSRVHSRTCAVLCGGPLGIRLSGVLTNTASACWARSWKDKQIINSENSRA